MSNLHLARASTRQRELALRLAVGADRGRLTRQLLAEALVLAVAASVVGVAIAFAGVRALAALQPANVPRLADVHVDAGVLGFALLVAVGTAVLLGVLTSLRTSPTRLRESLGEGQRTMGGGRGERVRQGLVVAQVALTIVLLVGAGLLTRSFMRVLAINPGYSTANALVLDIIWPFSRDPLVRQRRVESQRTALAGLGQLPGAERVGLVSSFPLGDGFFPNGRFIEMTRPDEITSFDDFGKLGDAAKARFGLAEYRIASEGYFAAMGIPLIRGRLFEVSDGPDAPHVAVISESLANSQVARSGSHRPLRPVRQHGRRPARLPHRRHRRRRAREFAGSAPRADLLRLLPAAANSRVSMVVKSRGAVGADHGGTADRADGRSGGPAADPHGRGSASTARSRAGASACCSSASSARARWCWPRSASTD